MTLARVLVAVVALAHGTAAIYMALLPPFPVRWLYHHGRWRKPVAWVLLALATAWIDASASAIAAWLVTLLGLVLAYRGMSAVRPSAARHASAGQLASPVRCGGRQRRDIAADQRTTSAGASCATLSTIATPRQVLRMAS